MKPWLMICLCLAVAAPALAGELALPITVEEPAGIARVSEPAPKAAGAKESFTVTGVPQGAKYFAVRAFDGTKTRSAMSNVAETGG